jgi:hypothetical protein
VPIPSALTESSRGSSRQNSSPIVVRSTNRLVPSFVAWRAGREARGDGAASRAPSRGERSYVRGDMDW